MTDQTDKDLAYQFIGALEPLGAQWAQLEDAVCGGRSASARALLKAFGPQLAEIVRLARLEVAENERLRALNAEMREALQAAYAVLVTLVKPDPKPAAIHVFALAVEAEAKARAILAKTESP